MRAGLALVAGFLVAAAAAITPHAGADTVVYVRGTLGEIPDGDTLLAGAYLGDEIVALDYPAAAGPFSALSDPTFGQSVDIGAANIGALVRSAMADPAGPSPVVIAGFSQGALVVQHAAAALNDDPSIPSETTFIEIANPNAGIFTGSYGHYVPGFDYVPRPLAETRFNVVVVTNEYDAWADPMVPSGNLLAGLNAVMAMAYLHPDAFSSDLSAVPPENITTTVNSQGGTTTTYLVPAQQLPLTMPLRQIGVPGEAVDDLDSALRPIVDAGYARHRPPAAAKSVADRAARGAANASAQPGDSSSRPAATGTSSRRSLRR